MPSRKKPKRENLAVADFETDPFKKGRGLADDPIEPFIVGFFDGVTMETQGGTAEEVCLWLIERSKRHGGIIFMHNGGNFDFHFLLEYLPVEDCKFFIVGKRIVQIITPWGAEFRDSFAIIPKAMKEYAKEKFAYWMLEKKNRKKYWAKIVRYLKSDLQNLWDMVSGFAYRYPLSLTLASTVFKIMKKDFGHDPERMNSTFDKHFRPYFFGGRVQFWQLGRCRGKHTIVDINSAYPYAMTFPHWAGGVASRGVTNKLPKKNFEQCFYDIDALSLGVFPVRQKGGGVEFPETEGRFQVTGWELAYGLESGRVVINKIHRVYHPKKVKDFKKFVQFYYEGKNAAKRAGDKAEEFFFKIVLNAGYGRYALQPMRYQEISVCRYGDTPEMSPKQKAEKIKWSPKYADKLRGLSFFSRKSYREGIDKFVNVATAASITGCVRAMLLRAMDRCEGVKYCDTDSICASEVSGLPMSDKLGEWKREIDFTGSNKLNSFWIAGKKLYAGRGKKPDGKREWKTASKGVRLSPLKIIQVAQGKTRKMTFTAPNYSVFSPTHFTTRTVRRADKRKKPNEKIRISNRTNKNS